MFQKIPPISADLCYTLGGSCKEVILWNLMNSYRIDSPAVPYRTARSHTRHSDAFSRRHALPPPQSTSSRSKFGQSRAPRHGQSLRRQRTTPSARVFSLSSAERTRTHGCGNTTSATSPTWMQASSQPTSCSPFTMRDCVQHGSDISTYRNSRRHSHRWQTMTSSPSSPSGTLRRRAFPRHATHSENLRWSIVEVL